MTDLEQQYEVYRKSACEGCLHCKRGTWRQRRGDGTYYHAVNVLDMDGEIDPYVRDCSVIFLERWEWADQLLKAKGEEVAGLNDDLERKAGRILQQTDLINCYEKEGIRQRSTIASQAREIAAAREGWCRAEKAALQQSEAQAREIAALAESVRIRELVRQTHVREIGELREGLRAKEEAVEYWIARAVANEAEAQKSAALLSRTALPHRRAAERRI